MPGEEEAGWCRIVRDGSVEGQGAGETGGEEGVEEIDEVIGEKTASFEDRAQRGIGKIAESSRKKDDQEWSTPLGHEKTVGGSYECGAGDTE